MHFAVLKSKVIIHKHKKQKYVILLKKTFSIVYIPYWFKNLPYYFQREEFHIAEKCQGIMILPIEWKTGKYNEVQGQPNDYYNSLCLFL